MSEEEPLFCEKYNLVWGIIPYVATSFAERGSLSLLVCDPFQDFINPFLPGLIRLCIADTDNVR